jgi:mannose-6-phosphate isomerase-like protein (cupin superfamily)
MMSMPMTDDGATGGYELDRWEDRRRAGECGVQIPIPLCIPKRMVLTSGGDSMSNVTSPARVAASLVELWSPRVVAEVDDAYVKVAKVCGSLAWHSHENEDELFFVLKGQVRIEMEGGAVELEEGEMLVVPKGVRHNPVAENECHLMLIERKTTLHTGDVVTEQTRSIGEQLRPI